ncbi:hypothetical protein RHMOL_Rhmol05G0211300 [Rhododendron molle]|uniref:Uncharacterized protein n=1 Tax=Rhododendron molle TaxID=49168 RepID=A0ACC0NRK2_RHOML|nr:hypothetical protein RHMOL_Rhmol05G0211300 [Rhododendron molle]
MGIKKYGKGDWRNISRNFVTSRTPTQVASHAQKYFIRHHLGGRDKRRSSIRDITTVNLAESKSNSPDNNRPPSPDHSPSVVHPRHHSSMSRMATTLYSWNPTNGSLLSLYGSQIGAYNPAFQIDSMQFQ